MEKQIDWVVKVKDVLERMDTIKTAEEQQWDKRSIFRVPASLMDLNEKAYMPQTVSFGPYHHGKRHLAPMEEHKHRALLHFLKRSNKPLESYVNSLAEIAQNLKDSYESLDHVWEKDNGKFLQIMIVDGCFLIEVLRNFLEIENDYVKNDPIFSKHGKLYIRPYIQRDMLMLENQLPMLLLTKLLEQDEQFVIKLILKFFRWEDGRILKFFGGVDTLPQRDVREYVHLLDVHREILLWQETHKAKIGRIKRWWRRILCRVTCSDASTRGKAGAGDKIIRSAKEINEAGINFKKSNSKSLKDISFQCGDLWLPPIVVDESIESMFLNHMAFERLHVGVGNEVTSYVFFMDSIIDTAEDVSLLHDKGIIQNAIGSDTAVAKLFNSISKDATPDLANKLNSVHEEVGLYCQQRINKWKANLKHTYFTNPWVIISVIAAFVLFTLTILQTVYSMLSYYHPQ